MRTTVIIPNWQGEVLLKKNLPAVKKLGADEIIIVDDASTDSSVDFIRENYPEIKLIVRPKNKGFASAVNEGVSAAVGDVVVLLNTDVAPNPDLLKWVLPHFKDKDIFAVSFNEGGYGPAKGSFKNGFVEHQGLHPTDQATKSFWASGGSAAFDRNKWKVLDGLNELYRFYWEDVDISYRAQKMGWKIIWEPKAKVIHEHETTTKRYFTRNKKRWIVERNQILFFWLNITDVKMWVRHVSWVIIRLLKPGYWIPFGWAVSMIPSVVYYRISGNKKYIRTDVKILGGM